MRALAPPIFAIVATEGMCSGDVKPKLFCQIFGKSKIRNSGNKGMKIPQTLRMGKFYHCETPVALP